MSHFASAARPLLLATGRTSGHAWIAFHRCVEAYCRLSGERFSTVFARLGLAHGFTAASSPEVAPLQAALTDLVAAREDLLRRRATLVTLRRAQKKAGRRVPRCEELQALEARHPVATALQPAVGCWGWRALREGRLGARLPLAGADMPPAHGAAGGRLFVDARRGPPTLGVADALTGVLAGGPARALRTQSGSNILKSLEAGRTLAPVLAVPRRVWRSRRLRRFRQTVPWNGVKQPPMPTRGVPSVGVGGRAYRLAVLLSATQVPAWTAWVAGGAARPVLEGLRRRAWGTCAAWVVCPGELSAGQQGDLLALSDSLRDYGWRLHRAALPARVS